MELISFCLIADILYNNGIHSFLYRAAFLISWNLMSLGQFLVGLYFSLGQFLVGFMKQEHDKMHVVF